MRTGRNRPRSDYIDPDVLDLIHDYQNNTAPARGVQLSLVGFQERYPQLKDRTQFVDYSSRELQDDLTPEQVLQILMEGHERFRAGAKLILVLGHTRCGAVTSAVKLNVGKLDPASATGCQHIGHIVHDIDEAIALESVLNFEQMSASERESVVNDVARRNVLRVVRSLREQSQTLDRLAREGKIVIVGAIYDVVSRDMEFLTTPNGEQPIRSLLSKTLEA